MKFLRAFAASVAFLAPALSAGQTAALLLSRIPEPVRGEMTAQLSFGAVVNPLYDDASGRSNELLHSLDLYRTELAVSYGLSSAFSLGIVATYASNRYCCSNGTSLSDSGFTGAGLFVDWSPGAPGGQPNRVRLGFKTERSPDDTALPVSDGQDRLFLQSDWTALSSKSGKARLGLRVDLEYGRPFEIQKAYFRGSGALAPEIAIVRTPSLDLDLAATAGYFLATDARENGTIFHNRRSTQGRGGIELHLALGRSRRDQLRIEVNHDLIARNALNGLRLGLTYRRSFGFRGNSSR